MHSSWHSVIPCFASKKTHAFAVITIPACRHSFAGASIIGLSQNREHSARKRQLFFTTPYVAIPRNHQDRNHDLKVVGPVYAYQSQWPVPDGKER